MVQHSSSYPDVGSIVEFMQENEPKISWVLQKNNGKLRLLLPNRKEVTVPISRILPWFGPFYSSKTNKDSVISLLEKHKKKRLELSIKYCPIKIWELIHGEIQYATADWLCALIEREPDIDAVAACAHSLLKYKTHFKFCPPNFEVYPKDIVEKRIQDQEKIAHYKEFIEKGSCFFKHLWEVYLKNISLDMLQLEAIKTIHIELEQYLLDEIIYQKTKNDTVWKSLVKSLPDDQYLAYHLAQTWGIIDQNYNFWLKRIDYETDNSWSTPYQASIDSIVKNSDNNTHYFSRKYISIDDETTKDIDDAFHIQEHSCGGWEIHVAIACPAMHWPFGSKLDSIVQKRATSVYLPEATYNMLPDILGTNVYSLHANKVRPAIVVKCIINREGVIQDYAVLFEYVVLDTNLTYKDCERIIDGCISSPYFKQVHLGFQLAQAYREYRLKNGAVIINRIEPKITLLCIEDKVKLFLEEKLNMFKAQLVISEIMILVNSTLAQWALERNIPLLHRTQDVVVPNEYRGVWSEPSSIVQVMKILSSSTMEVDEKPHASIGVQRYTPTTSPLRRYPDMINEAQIFYYIQYNKIRWSYEELSAMLPYISRRLELVNQAQRYRVRYWKLMYMLQQDNDKWWSGIIVDIGDIFVSVYLPQESIMLRAKITLFKQNIHLGQKVYVHIESIKPLYNESFITKVQEA